MPTEVPEVDIAFSGYPPEAGPAVERQAQLLRALGHPVRLQLVRALAEAPLSVSALSQRLDLPQSRVSQQLSLLRHQNLVSAIRRQGFAIYHLAEPHLRALVACLDECCPPTATAAGSAR